MFIILCVVLRSVCLVKYIKRGVSVIMIWFTQVELFWCLFLSWVFVYSFEIRGFLFIVLKIEVLCYNFLFFGVYGFFFLRGKFFFFCFFSIRFGIVFDNGGRFDCFVEFQDLSRLFFIRLGLFLLRYSFFWFVFVRGGVVVFQSIRVISRIFLLK